MKPVWIIDDDRSIRWVFEKALKRENLPHRIFDSAEDALAALLRRSDLELDDAQVRRLAAEIHQAGQEGR